MIQASDLSLCRGGSSLLSGVSLEVPAGGFVAVVGPNGAGKSTLLSLLSGEVRPDGGVLRFAGRAMDDWTVRDLARRRAVMTQHSTLAFPFTVAEVVALGLDRAAGGDSHSVAAFLAAAHLNHMAPRLYPTLSGGEKQRVHFARALAQLHQVPPHVSPLLLMDEPTSSLDPGHQHLVMGAVRKWMGASGGTAMAVLHDLTLAAQYADLIVVMARGRVLWQGKSVDLPVAVLTQAYGVAFHRVDLPGEGGEGYVSIPHGRDASLGVADDNANYYHAYNFGAVGA